MVIVIVEITLQKQYYVTSITMFKFLSFVAFVTKIARFIIFDTITI